MELKIISKSEQPLLSRVEYSIDVAFDKATPSKWDLRKKISAELNIDEKLIVVKKISTEFGEVKARATAYSYFSEEDLKNIEPKPKEKKDAKKEAEKPAEPKK